MLEELTKEYSLACAKAVKDAIHELAEKWGNKVVDELNADVQEAFDKLGFQVVLNAMIHYGMESTDEPLYWRIY